MNIVRVRKLFSKLTCGDEEVFVAKYLIKLEVYISKP